MGCVHWDRNVSSIQWTEESRYWIARQSRLMEGSTRQFKNFCDAEHKRTRRCLPQKGQNEVGETQFDRNTLTQVNNIPPLL